MSVAQWQYADWRRQPTVPTQRDRLILHIEEVSQWVIEARGRGGREVRLDQTYLPSLRADLTELERRIAVSQRGGPRRTRIDFMLLLIAVSGTICNQGCKICTTYDPRPPAYMPVGCELLRTTETPGRKQ